MLANDLRISDADEEILLSDSLNRRLLETLSDYARLLLHYNIHVRISSKSSILKLKETSSSKKQEIILYFQNCMKWFQPVSENSVVEKIDIELEKVFLKRALDHYGMIADDEFWKTIESDHLVEIYGKDMVQLYRSLNFFEITGYSLLDLSLYEWFVLYERPTRALSMIHEVANSVVENFTPVQKFSVPKHVLREIYDTGKTEPFHPRASLVEFSYIASVRHHRLATNPNGLIVSCKAQLIAEGADATQIQFI